MRLTPDKPIILQRRRQGNGRSNYAVEAEAEVMCAASEPGIRRKADAAAAGYALDLTVQLWRSEYEADHYTHAVFDGKEYRIADAGPGRNGLFVVLSLVRG